MIHDSNGEESEIMLRCRYVKAPLHKCMTCYRYFVFYSLDLMPADLCKENLCTLPCPVVCVRLWEGVVIMGGKLN